MSEVTNEDIERWITIFDDNHAANGSGDWGRAASALRELKQLREELKARRAADEGAVTVEGWLAADCCLDGRIYFNHEGEMMIFSDAPAGPDRDKEVQVAVTIRRKP